MLLKELNKEEYLSFTNNHNTHFLQSFEWGELSKTRGYTPYYLGLIDKNKIVATALLLKKDLLFGYSYFYIPRGYTIDYNNLELVKEFTMKIKEFCKARKAIFFRIDPDIKYQTIDDNANLIEGENNYQLVEYLVNIGFKRRPLTKFFETMQPRYTFRIDLTKENDELNANYSQAVRHHVKRANKYGVAIHEGTKDNIKDFISLMKLTEKRQGFYSHPDSFYYDFYELFKDHLTILLAEIDLNFILNMLNKEIDSINSMSKKDENHLNKLEKEKQFYENKIKEKNKIYVSSYFMVTYGNKSWYLYGANDMEYKDTCANYKLFDYQIKKAKELGSTIFDEFGTIGDPKTDSNLVGLHEFKKKWGGEYTEFIGEFDMVLNRFMYFVYLNLIPIRHKIINKKLRKEVRS